MSLLLIKDANMGEIPPTPTSLEEIPETPQAQKTLKQVAYQHGLPASYKQEQDGKLTQNIFPIRKRETTQISSSSKIDLQLHTESAFHPYSPAFVILMCLREDLNAVTTFATVDDIVSTLDNETLFCLKEPLFITAIDESFRTHGEPNKNIILPILTETTNGLNIQFDEFYMRGKTFQAQEALDKLLESIKTHTKEIVLETGDILVIDNRKVVHGRKSFTAKYDGTDRWLQRMLVLDKMPPETDYVYEDHLIVTTEM